MRVRMDGCERHVEYLCVAAMPDVKLPVVASPEDQPLLCTETGSQKAAAGVSVPLHFIKFSISKFVESHGRRKGRKNSFNRRMRGAALQIRVKQSIDVFEEK